ncbi:unnamed protein product [Sympodiomycopsis kandeliae]
MDLETYALSYNAGEGSDSNNHQQSDKGKGKSRAVDADNESIIVNEGPTLQSDVQQLTTSLGSWWSGFSKSSAETFTQASNKFQEASKTVNEQGGIVSFARNEASKLEKELGQKRKEAMERVKKEEEEEKLRRAQEQQERDQEEEKQGRSSGDKRERSSTSNREVHDTTSGQEIFDAEKPSENDSSTSSLPTSDQALSAASTTMTNLFTRLQSLSKDPRITSLQQEFTNRIQSLNTQSQQTNEKGEPTTTTTTSIFPKDLMKSLQNLSHLEGTEDLTKKYKKISDDLIHSVGHEWKDFVNELVRVVPPVESSEGNEKSEGEDKSQDIKADVEQVSSSQEEKTNVEKVAASPVASSKAIPDTTPTSTSTTSSTAVPPAKTQEQQVETTSKPEHKDVENESDDDSDWE